MHSVRVQADGTPEDALACMHRDCALYRQKSESIQLYALLECLRVRLQCFIEVCALTWATAVFLGGALKDLTWFQLLYILLILMQQAAHFGVNVFCPGALPTTRLIHKNSIRDSLAHSILTRLLLLSSLEFIFTYMFLVEAPFFIMSVLGNHDLSDRLRLACVVSALLQALNGIVGFLPSLFRCTALLKWYNWPSHLKFYDTLVQTGLVKGVRGLRQMNVVDALFEFMGEEFKNKAQPKEVYAAYRNMIHFVCMHERGFQAAKKAMQSEDPFIQQASVHMVEFWLASEQRLVGRGHPARLCFETVLLQMLVEVAVQGVGLMELAAARCVHELAKQHPALVLLKAREASVGQSLIQRMVNRMEELLHIACISQALHCEVANIDVNLYNWLLYAGKAVISVLENNQAEFCQSFTPEEIHRLCRELLATFKQSHRSWKRMQVVAGEVLRRLAPSCLSEESVYMHLKAREAAPPCRVDMHDDECRWFDELMRYSAIRPLEWDGDALIRSISTQLVDDPHIMQRFSPQKSLQWTIGLIISIVVTGFPLFMILAVSYNYKSYDRSDLSL